MAKFRCNEVVTDVTTLRLRDNYVSEGRIPEASKLKIDCPGRVLGRVSGIGFMGDFMSDNGRWYPSALWSETCNADYVKEQIDKRLMFGTCGHPDSDDPLMDFQVGDGTNSHVITKLDYSNAPTGIIEYIILDTDWGRNLYAALCAGSILSVSSRAMADYIPGEYHNGQPVMDPASYYLDTFDIVRIPGIAVATPNCVELREALDAKINKAVNSASKVQVPVKLPKASQVVKEAMTDQVNIIHKVDYTGFLF